MSMDENYKIDLDETIKMFTNQSTSRANQLTEKKNVPLSQAHQRKRWILNRLLINFAKVI